MAGPGLGDLAPDFTLPGTIGNGSAPGDGGDATFTLSEKRGSPVVLAFYPGDDTPVCTLQLKAYNQDLAQFGEMGTTLWAISPQSVKSHEDFSGRHDLGFPLLADVDKATFKAYGCLGPLGFPRRSVFVIDREGIIRYCHRAGAGLTFKKTTELVEAVKATL